MQFDYVQKLRDPRWQMLRLRLFERDGWACRFCQATSRTLHAHHLEYVRGREPWEYPLESLLTLCEPCHGGERERLKFERELALTLRRGLSVTGLLHVRDAFAAPGAVFAQLSAPQILSSGIRNALATLTLNRAALRRSQVQLLLNLPT